MTLLPQKLTTPNEGSRITKLPAYNITPLIETEGQVSMRANPLGVSWIHNRFAGSPAPSQFNIRYGEVDV